MACFIRRPSNDFNFATWQVGSDVLVSDLVDDIPNCTLTASAPTNPIAQAQTTGDIDLTWSYPDGQASAFEIWISNSPVTGFSLLGTVTETKAIISGLSPSDTKWFKVRALGALTSAFSPEVSDTTYITQDLSLSILTLTGLSQTSVRMDWSYNLIDKDTELDWSQDITFGSIEGATIIGKGVGTYTIPDTLTANVAYYFRLNGITMSNYYKQETITTFLYIVDQNGNNIIDGSGNRLIQT